MEKSFVTVRGNLTRDPDFKEDFNLLKFSIASNRLYYKNNEPVEETSFFDITAWGKVAEWAVDTLEKGLPVIVYGRLEQQTWETDEGNRSKIEIVAEAIGVDCMGIGGVDRRTGGSGQKKAKPKAKAGKKSNASAGNPMDDYSAGKSGPF